MERNRDFAFSPLSPNLLEAASPPRGKKKSHQKKKKKKKELEDAAGPSASAPRPRLPPRSPRWLGTEGGGSAWPRRRRLAPNPLYTAGCGLPGRAVAGALGPPSAPPAGPVGRGFSAVRLPRGGSGGEGALSSWRGRRGRTPTPRRPFPWGEPGSSKSRQERAAADCPASRSFLLSRLLLKGGGDPRTRGRGWIRRYFY